MATENKDFKVKHGLTVTDGAVFGAAIEIGEPTANDHAATKGYVDGSISTLYANLATNPALVATVSNIDLATETVSGAFIDGFELLPDTRILVKDQILGQENGIYTVQPTGPAIRSGDYNDENIILPGGLIYVFYGDTNAGTYWALSTYTFTLDVDPISFEFIGPPKAGNGLVFVNNEIEIDPEKIATINIDEQNEKVLDPFLFKSSLETLGNLRSLVVDGTSTFNNNVTVDAALNVVDDLEVSGNITADASLNVTNNVQISGNIAVAGTSNFAGQVTIPVPTQPLHPATKGYVDSLLGQERAEITTIDDLSNYFNGFESRFKPTYQGIPVTLQNPFNLLLTIDGIIQSVGYPDYVWQSVMPRVGFRIDNDGFIAFPEPIPVGSSFDARVLVGSAVTQQTKVYPFKAMDIVLGGY